MTDLNREHLKRLNESELALLLQSSDASIGAIAKLHLQEASTLNEIREKMDCIFAPKDIYALYEGQDFSKEAQILYNALQELIQAESSALQEYESLKEALLARTNLKGKSFFKPLRILLTGNSHGLELNELYPYLRFFLDEIVRLK